MSKIGFIGCGTMGSAIVKAIAPHTKEKILLYDIDEMVAISLAKISGGVSLPLKELLSEAETIVLAVKPQVLPLLYGDLYQATEKRWISLAAGVSLETLVSNLGSEEVIRIMPNIGAEVSRSVTAVTPCLGASKEFIKETLALVEKFGSAHILKEEHLAAFIGVSASAIATCFEFLHGIALGGVQQGLPYKEALALISETMESATALIRQGERHPQELQTGVCSPQGTTIEALNVVFDNSLAGILMESVWAASERALELEMLAKKENN
jgi:pyrroline-5-carboxylate reductase